MVELPLTDARNPAPAPHQPRPVQLQALTSVRFFAALYVALYHMVRPFERWGPLAGFAATGYTGVSFFFLLSGFILTYTHAREPSTGPGFVRRFYFARFARIYPVYFLATVASAFLISSQLHNPIHLLALAGDFVMLQTWSIRMVSFFNVPAWSISMEVFFYVVFPFVYRRLKTESRGRAIGLFLLFWLLAMAVPLLAVWKAPAGAWHEDAGGLFVFWIRRFPPLALPEFLAGVMLGWLYLAHPPSRGQALVFALVGIAGLAVLLPLGAYLPMVVLHNGLLLPLFALVILGLTRPTWLTRALSIAPLILLGEASYALYLTHFMLSDWMDRTFGHDADFSWLAVKLPVAVGLSIALYVFVERPGRRRLLQWWNQKHAARG